VWNEPLDEPCPDCGWPILTVKVTKRKGAEKVCPQKECGFSEPYEREDEAEEAESE
jgi:DNA topoisomerase-1